MCENSFVRVLICRIDAELSSLQFSSAQPLITDTLLVFPGASFSVSSGANVTLKDVNISPTTYSCIPAFVVIVSQTDESEQQETNTSCLLNKNRLCVRTV